MLSKPETCRECPAYADGKGFTPDTVVPGAAVEIRGQNPGSEEERVGAPFVGKTGKLMEAVFLPLAGLDRSQVTFSNAFRCRWTENGRKTDQLPRGKGSKALLDAMLTRCRQYDPPPPTQLYVAQGESAWKSLGGPGTISEWRGNTIITRQADTGAEQRHDLGAIAAALPSAADGSQDAPAPLRVLATLHLASLFKPSRTKR